MKTTFISKLTTLIVVTLFVFATSCQNEDPVKKADQDNFKIEPLTDQKIIAEIQAMAAAGRDNSQGRTAVALPGVPQALPPGYNYASMQQVTIAGTNWVTYVAKSTTVNTPSNKESVALYYQGGVFKNYLLHKWEKRTIRLRDGSTEISYHTKFKLPENYCISQIWDINLIIEPQHGSMGVDSFKVYPPGVCGQSVIDCIADFYGNHGWASVGWSMATWVVPEIGIGVIGGCAVGCMLYGPTVFLTNC